MLRRLLQFQFKWSLGRSILSRFYKPGRTYTAPIGPLRGLKLHYTPAINFHVMLGVLDVPSFRVLRALLPQLRANPAPVAYDVGANAGGYSLWLGRELGKEGKIWAFEPGSAIQPVLERNISDNGMSQVTVVKAACGDTCGKVKFYLGADHHVSSIHASWNGADVSQFVEIDGVTLDSFAEQNGHSPVFIKMDIEGGGTHALPGMKQILKNARPYVLVESHTPDEDRAISNAAIEAGYHAWRVSDGQWVKKPDAIFPDPQGISGTVFLVPYEKAAAFASALSLSESPPSTGKA